MGTNFYVTSGKPCSCCGGGGELKHIGKSSAGWCFALHVYPDENINTLEDWQKFWEDKEISNEYEEIFTSIQMEDYILNRGREDRNWESKPHGYESWTEFHRMNYSEVGPNGLLRSKIDGRHCIGHGNGTYDFIVGDFS